MIYLTDITITLNILKLKCANVGHIEEILRLFNCYIHIISKISNLGTYPCKCKKSVRIHNVIKFRVIAPMSECNAG